MATTAIASVSEVPQYIQAFAAERGASLYLPALLGLARRIFPEAAMSIRLEADPELENDRHIAIEVDASGLSVDEMLACQNQWDKEIFDHCPATHVCTYRLAMV
jgi:hypothetical protein